MKNFFLTLLLFVLLLQFPTLTSPYQFIIPNYQSLKNLNILNQNNQLNYNQFVSFSSSQQPKKSDKQKGQNNESLSYKLLFQMIIYPYRVYSYFDQSYKKQFIFKRIDFFQFTNHNQKYQFERQKEGEDRLKQNIRPKLLQAQFYVKQCLFKTKQPNLYSENIIIKPQQSQQVDYQKCLKQHQLYQLLPRYLTIQQDKNEQIQIQKLNDQYIVIKNYIHQNITQQSSFFKIIELVRINIHTYIFQARQNLIGYFYQNKIIDRQGIQNLINKQDDQDLEQKQKEQLFKLDQLKVRIADTFKTQQQIWSVIHQRNRIIFSYLFHAQNRINIKPGTLYDYVASQNTYYLVKVYTDFCPYSTHDDVFSLFYPSFSELDQSQLPNSQKMNKQNQQNCTYLIVHKVPFIQFEAPEPIQHITKQTMFEGIKLLAVGLVQKQQTNQHPTEYQLCIHLETKQIKIQIWYGNKWKQIRTEPTNEIQLSKQIKNDHIYQLTHKRDKVFFLQNLLKVQIKHNKATIFKRRNQNSKKFVQQCSIPLLPFVLTSAKLNNQHFVVCIQGSKCLVFNQKCKIVNKLQFENAFGIEWKYKYDYRRDNIISYAIAERRIAQIYNKIQLPLDLTKVNKNFFKTGQFFQKYQLKKISPYQYEIDQRFINTNVDRILEKDVGLYLAPRFQQSQLKYNFKPIRLFQDRVYHSSSYFKRNILDSILNNLLALKFKQFYFPQPDQFKPNGQLQFFNFNNDQYFNNYFDDCTFEQDQNLIHFEIQWRACRIVLRTESLFLMDSYLSMDQFKNQKKLNSSSQSNKKSELNKQNLNQKQQKQQITLNVGQQIIQIADKQNFQNQPNVMISCSMHKNGPPYSKCKVSEYQITQNFYQRNKKVKFYIQGGRYYQLYLFNRKFITQSTSQSFLQLLQRLANQHFEQISQSQSKLEISNQKFSKIQQFKGDSDNKQLNLSKQSQNNEKSQQFKVQTEQDLIQLKDTKPLINSNISSPQNKSQLKLYKIILSKHLSNLLNPSQYQEKNISKENNTASSSDSQIPLSLTELVNKNCFHYDIILIDYQKQQMQSISRVLLIIYCIFFPVLSVCCCVICFKTFFQNLLIYYGVIRGQPSFRYPLNNIALKIKMKDMKKNGYAKIHKNKRTPQKNEQIQSTNDIRFSIECCFCLQELKFNQQVVQLYCKHQYHTDCFVEWIKNQPNPKCPLCKRTFTKSALNQFNQSNRSSSPIKSTQNRSSSDENHLHENQVEFYQLDLEPVEFED